MGAESLWEEYKKNKSDEIREKLILEYTYLVKYVASRLSTHVGAYVDFDDLISYGIFGLIDAIDKFDYKKGVKFDTYATLRIRGEMLDNIRKLDWVPRTLRQKNKLLDKNINEFELKNGRQPTNYELAQILNLSVEEVDELVKKSNVASLISLDDYLEQGNETVKANLIANKNESPEASLEYKENKKMLIEAINSLTDKQKLVITLYYYEELTLKEISKIMNVSESRISQIHSKSISLLQAKLGKNKGLMFFN